MTLDGRLLVFLGLAGVAGAASVRGSRGVVRPGRRAPYNLDEQRRGVAARISESYDFAREERRRFVAWGGWSILGDRWSRPVYLEALSSPWGPSETFTFTILFEEGLPELAAEAFVESGSRGVVRAGVDNRRISILMKERPWELSNRWWILWQVTPQALALLLRQLDAGETEADVPSESLWRLKLPEDLRLPGIPAERVRLTQELLSKIPAYRSGITGSETHAMRPEIRGFEPRLDPSDMSIGWFDSKSPAKAPQFSTPNLERYFEAWKRQGSRGVVRPGRKSPGTQAEQMAKRFNGDGQLYLDADGVRMGEALDNAKVERIPTTERGSDVWRFPDGSAIATTEGGWDIVNEFEPGRWGTADTLSGEGWTFETETP